MGANDSIITFGLELAEETEKSTGEIVSGIGNEQAAPPQPEYDQATIEEAQARVQLARDFEAAENAKQLELEHQSPEQ